MKNCAKQSDVGNSQNSQFSFKNTFSLSIAGQRLKKHPGEVGAGHHLWDHRLCHGGGQHHGHGLLQDGQAASDHLQLLSLQVFLLRCVSIKLQ